MIREPIIIINTDDAPVYCSNRCGNMKCTKHQSRGFEHQGVCKFSALKDSTDCEGYFSNRAKHAPSR